MSEKTSNTELIMTPGGSEALLKKIDTVTARIQRKIPDEAQVDIALLMSELVEYARELEWRTIHLSADLDKLKARLG